ncbi:hypothetical protein [Bacillus infantis]|uniref:hypothetical protein n=1 Tax=Bacillus infantis TaxID=324767 RepID=UPI003CE9B974
MIQPIKSVKKVEVADLLRLNIQFFSEEPPAETVETLETEPEPAEPTEPVDIPEDEPGVTEQEPAEPAQPFKEDPQNQAFAQMRREKEAAERQLKEMDAVISETYGESHGIHTFAEYQAAVQAEKEAAERQKYVDAGLPDDVIDKLSKVDEVLKQAEEEKFSRALMDNFTSLQQEYPELVKEPQDINAEVWAKWDDGKTGLSLTEAYELVNKKAIREHLQASAKQSAMNKINGKAHVRGNGGEGADDVDLGVVPPDVMQQYRTMFSKELKTGQMSEKDFVAHYKKSL